MTTRDGAWMQTYTGRQYWPLDPRSNEVFIEDIAHALSLSCRFSGHCVRFYSVAEHSVRCVRWLAENMDDMIKEYSLDEESMWLSQKWTLMHDAAEAYVSDVPRPIKPYLGGFDEIEEKNLKAIAGRFSLKYPMPESIAEIVKKADNIILMTEKRDNMAKCDYSWGLEGKVWPDRKHIVPYSPEEAKRGFMECYEYLFGA